MAYEIDVPSNWKIHLVISVAHLEPATTQDEDPYHSARPDYPDAVYVEGDTENSKSYEIEAILAKRTSERHGEQRNQYLVRWKGYGPEFDEWYGEDKLDNAKELVEKYEEANWATETTKRAGRRTRRKPKEVELLSQG